MDKSIGHEQSRRQHSIDPSKRQTRTSTARTRMTNATTSWHASSYQQTSEINGGPSTVSHKATTTVTRQHPKVIEDEASMQVPMRFFP